MPQSYAVRKARKASASQLEGSVPSRITLKDIIYSSRVVWASQLIEIEREKIWTIADQNMRDIATTSSMGWDPKLKKKELFHGESRFVIAYKNDEASWLVNDISGFAMFRFEEEYDEKLLYCYELQVSPTYQRSGLGRFLMRCLTDMGRHWKLDKIILTVLKVNQNALRFYQTMGFEMDPTSPDFVEEGSEEGVGDEGEGDECDYEILSKEL